MITVFVVFCNALAIVLYGVDCDMSSTMRHKYPLKNIKHTTIKDQTNIYYYTLHRYHAYYLNFTIKFS